MKKRIFFFILFFSLLNSVNISAETKILYVDLDKVVAKSIAGKNINDQIKKIQKVNLKKIKDSENKLLENEKKIISQKNVLDKNEYNEKVKLFKVQVDKHNNEKKNMNIEFNNKRLKATTQLLDNLNPILAQYSEDNSISMIIQKKNIIIGKSELDITDDIIKLLNKKIKVIDIK